MVQRQSQKETRKYSKKRAPRATRRGQGRERNGGTESCKNREIRQHSIGHGTDRFAF